MNEPTPWIAGFVQDYVRSFRRCLVSSLGCDLDDVVRCFAEAVTAERATINAFGNGGSSAIAQTLGWELREILGGFLRQTRCTGDWTSHHLVEEAEGSGFERSIVGLLQRSGTGSRDLVVLISASGNSRNVVAAGLYCRETGIPAVTFTGRSGGALGRLGLPGLRVDSDDQQLIEDCTHAAIHILLHVTAQVLTTGARGRPDADALAAGVDAAVRQSATWIDQLSSRLAEAALLHRRVNVVAPEGGALAVSVEHIAHNLVWDLSHRTRDASLDVRLGPTLADYTGMSNDCGGPGVAATAFLDRTGLDDVTVLFAHDADHGTVMKVREVADGKQLSIHGWYGTMTRCLRNEHVALVGGDRMLRVLNAQLTGHLLLRATRAKVARHLRGWADLVEEERCARTPVAPLQDCGVRQG